MNCWEKNGFESKEEALNNAVGMVMKFVPKSTIIYLGELFQSGVTKLPKNVQKTLRTDMAR
jgi:hypothetical protein